MLNTLQAKNRNLKKTTIKMLSARMTDEYPIHLGFVETARDCNLNIYLNSHLRFSRFQNQGMVAWMSLVKYLKQFIEYVDIQKISSMVIDYGKNRLVNSTQEKNRLLMQMFLLLVSEKSVMVRTYLGGYTVRFLDSEFGKIKRAIERLSKEHILKIQKRVKLCQPSQDKLVEILFSKLYPKRGPFETGEYFTVQKQITEESPYTFGQIKETASIKPSNTTFKQLKPAEASLGIPSIRSARKKSSMQILNMESISMDGETKEIPPIDLKQLLVLTPLPIPGDSESHSNPQTSKRSLASPVLKDRFSRLGALTASLISFDELTGMLEDERTKLDSIYKARKQHRTFLKAKSRLFASSTPLSLDVTYPKIFRLNPIIVTMIMKDYSLGKTKPFLVCCLTMKLPTFEEASLVVDFSNREMAENQISKPIPVKDFINICSICPNLFGDAVSTVKRGNNLKRSLKLEIIRELKQKIETTKGVIKTKGDGIPLVQYLPNLVDDLKPTKDRVLKTLAQGLVRLSNINPSKRAGKNIKIPISGFKQIASQARSSILMKQRHSRLSPRKRAYLIEEEHLPQTPVLLKLKINGSRIYLHIAHYKEISQTTLFLRFYNPDFSQATQIEVTSPVDINKVCAMIRAGSEELQATAFGFLVQYRKSWIGNKHVLSSRRVLGDSAKHDKLSSDKILDLLWRDESQRDIQSAFDQVSYTILLNDGQYGRLTAECSLFYTFREPDIWLLASFASTGKRNTNWKLALAKADLETHVHPNFMNIIFDRGVLIKALQTFLQRLSFERDQLYYAPLIVHKKSATGHVLSGYSNLVKKTSGSSFLEFRKIQREVVCQFVFRVQKFFIMTTVFRHRSSKQHDIELYFPKTQKRFCFEMFNDELLRMDRQIVSQIYPLTSSEIMFLAEVSKFDYRALLLAIKDAIVI